MNKKIAISFALLMSTGVGAYFVVSRGLYPIMFVGFHPIFQRDIETSYRAALRYTIIAAETYGQKFLIPDKTQQADIYRASLDQAINTVLIDAEVKNRLHNDFTATLNQKLQAVQADENFKSAATSLYGLSFDAYESIFLIPLAEQEILDDRLHLDNNGNVSQWLAQKRKQSVVVILVPNFAWVNGKIISTAFATSTQGQGSNN